jgi:beta-N-acetylhexosaminidase
MAESMAPGPESNDARPSRRAMLAGTAGLGLAGAFGWWQAAPGHVTGQRPIRQPGSTLPAGFPPGLTNQQLAGQRVIYSYPGTTPPSSLLSDISAGLVGGVIFFGENITGESQIAAVISQLRQAAAHSPVKVPLLLMTDQEGGLVRRLPGQPTLSAKQMGQAADPVAAAGAGGTGAGQNLRGVGMNVNLAPVLDVFYSAGDFIDQYQRSFSNNPATVASLGSAFISAQQATGVAATAKHFPGLGAATRSANTDLGPVTLRQSLTQIRSVDELPYTNAIAAGVQLVMTSWALYPALDHNRPAGLSARIIGRELRGRLGYHGVIITDAITAGALARYGSVGSRALLAAQAGADLILCAAPTPSQNSPAIGLAAFHALETGLQHGQLSSSAARQGAARVLALRQLH